MMIHKQKKVKLANKETTNRRNPDWTLGIYFTAFKVAQYIHVAENRREKGEAKKVTEKKTATRKMHIRLNKHEAFDRCINSMKSLSLSTTNEERLIQLMKK